MDGSSDGYAVGAGGDSVPCETLYLQNLSERLPKEELKKALYSMFTQFGRVLAVHAVKTYRLRGQAWVAFADISCATSAMRELQGFPFFDKPMRISYAREKSDAVAKLEGTYVPKDRRSLRQQRKEEDQQRHAEAERRKREQPSAESTANANAADTSAPPNKVLFVQGLPYDANDSQLAMLFSQFPGYKETRMVPAKPGIAFVEYESEAQAGEALRGTDNFQLDSDHTMSVTYARKAQS